MRRLLIAGNWKMNLKLDSAKALAQGLKEAAAGVSEVDIAVCPSPLYVQPVAEILKGSNIGVGAQNAYFEKAGAFTGEIEMAMLTDVGANTLFLVIVNAATSSANPANSSILKFAPLSPPASSRSSASANSLKNVKRALRMKSTVVSSTAPSPASPLKI